MPLFCYSDRRLFARVAVSGIRALEEASGVDLHTLLGIDQQTRELFVHSSEGTLRRRPVVPTGGTAELDVEATYV